MSSRWAGWNRPCKGGTIYRIPRRCRGANCAKAEGRSPKAEVRWTVECSSNASDRNGFLSSVSLVDQGSQHSGESYCCCSSHLEHRSMVAVVGTPKAAVT